jgi:DNA-binding protein HU-beta
VNRRELIAAVATQTGQSTKDVDATMKAFVDVVLATVSKGDPVAIPGFAKFAKRQTKARMGRNPATGEPVKIKASTKARITPLKGFKDVVSGAAKPPKLGAPKPAPVKAAPAKKAAPVKKAAAKKAAPAKKAAAKKAPAKKAPAKKAAKKR